MHIVHIFRNSELHVVVKTNLSVANVTKLSAKANVIALYLREARSRTVSLMKVGIRHLFESLLMRI